MSVIMMVYGDDDDDGTVRWYGGCVIEEMKA